MSRMTGCFSTRLGAAAAEAILDGDFGKMMGSEERRYRQSSACRGCRETGNMLDPDSDIIKEARMTGISFGDK